ncbi:MAG: preprotein translocase subunit SecG [Clostridia bacterium]|nr:preprotein translocase subunit SecG [Clostridia bacterium]
MNLNNLQFFAVEAWVSSSFPIIRMVLIVLIAILSLALVLCILFQDGEDGSGMNAMTGASTETFYAKNKSQTVSSLLKRLTIILAVTIAVLAVLFFISVSIYNGN